LELSTVESHRGGSEEAVGIGAEVCLVTGAGNIFRGLKGAAAGMDRATADYMGQCWRPS